MIRKVAEFTESTWRVGLNICDVGNTPTQRHDFGLDVKTKNYSRCTEEHSTASRPDGIVARDSPKNIFLQ